MSKEDKFTNKIKFMKIPHRNGEWGRGGEFEIIV